MKLRKLFLALVGAAILPGSIMVASADEVPSTDSLESRLSGAAVSGFNATVGLTGNYLDGTSSVSVVSSFTTSVPFLPSFGFQGDMAVGNFGNNTGEASETFAGHLFWRNPDHAMLGIFADWGNLNAHHFGRLGFEGARYYGPWSVEVLLGIEFGQHVITKFVDEVDISYHFDENFKASVGHRYMSRGHIVNIGFEKQFAAGENVSWSLFGVGETGEDNFTQAFFGVRASLGSQGAVSLQERDRRQNIKVRIPRNLSSITQCAKVDKPFRDTQLLLDLGLVSKLNRTLCGSKSKINKLSSTGIIRP